MKVLSLESRRSREIARLIENRGGEPVLAPAVREVRIEPADEVKSFVAAVQAGEVDGVIFLTGVGTRALVESARLFVDPEVLVAALRRLPVVARSAKPAAALRELQIPITLSAPEPNTWREILQVIDANPSVFPLRGRRIAIQEHGERSDELQAALIERGARVLSVQVYRWDLPEDTAPLQSAVHALTHRQIDVVLITAAVQIQNLLKVADRTQSRADVLQALSQTMVCSIGPVASAELRRHGIEISVEPAHPRMAFLINEAADQAHRLERRR